MSYGSCLQRHIDNDLAEQILASGKVRRQPKQSKARSFVHKTRRNHVPDFKDQSFKGPIRKNQKRNGYF